MKLLMLPFSRISTLVSAALILMFSQCGLKPITQKDLIPIIFEIDTTQRFQTIHNFGASDAWSIQFVGKYWPRTKRERIAQLLFSTEMDPDGHPNGIGLTAWRFNIGGGSAEQGDSSKIRDAWRRAECFLDAEGNYDWTKQAGQQWFLRTARDYDVNNFIGFVNSPPVSLTRNGKAWSDEGLTSNLPGSNYQRYAEFLAMVIEGIEENTSIRFDYISPFNEPQWEWMCCNQEGSPWNNDELAEMTSVLNKTLLDKALTDVQIEITEAGQIDYLYNDALQPRQRNDQIQDFFSPNSQNYIGDLEQVAGKIAGHSYFSTWDINRLVETRKKLRQSILQVNPNLEYWMSEYTILENNPEIKGRGRDLGIGPALYMARVIQADLIFAHASAWHWWLAVSPYDYKDGLIYIDKEQENGQIMESKMLWALGNFSRFIRPGAVRIGMDLRPETRLLIKPQHLLASAYRNETGELVAVFVNQYEEPKRIEITSLPENQSIKVYLTSGNEGDNLRYLGESGDPSILLPSESIVTCVIE